MGDAKQIEAKRASTTKASKTNGKAVDDQLVDEVKKLDQIRDMLFGEHVASLQDRYQNLDKNLDQNVSDLRKELSTSVKDLKQQIESKFQQLQNSLQAEQAERLAQNEEIRANLSSVNTDILTKIDLEAKKMDEALNQQHEEATRQLNAMVDSLQHAKVDRESLADLFSQVAKQLKG